MMTTFATFATLEHVTRNSLPSRRVAPPLVYAMPIRTGSGGLGANARGNRLTTSGGRH
jgi:hypothetical protein